MQKTLKAAPLLKSWGLGLATLTVLGIATPPARAQYDIGGVTYAPSQPQESLTATFTVPDGGVTVNGYSGYVLLDVSGVGQSYSAVYNDAFYLYTDQYAATPTNGHDGAYYELAFDTQPLVLNNFSRDADNFIYGGLPAYNPSHEYTFILNTGLSAPGSLHFGVSDGGYSDNTGAYNISVKQLAPTPEPSQGVALSLGVIGLAWLMLRSRRRKPIA